MEKFINSKIKIKYINKYKRKNWKNKMNTKIFFTFAVIIFFSLNFISAISVDADYITIFSG